jgi:hypothetical protein
MNLLSRIMALIFSGIYLKFGCHRSIFDHRRVNRITNPDDSDFYQSSSPQEIRRE